MKVIEGKLSGKGRKIAIVVARFNEFITESLLEACVDELDICGVAQEDITVVKVPGAFEIPIVAQKLAQGDYHVVICLACVIKGETDHYTLVSEGAMQGIIKASLKTEKPFVFEILACETVQLAKERARTNGLNKGREAAHVALEMIDVCTRI